MTATVVSRVAFVILQHGQFVCWLSVCIRCSRQPGHSSCDMASNQHNATCKCLVKLCGKLQQQHGLAEPASIAWADQAKICQWLVGERLAPQPVAHMLACSQKLMPACFVRHFFHGEGGPQFAGQHDDVATAFPAAGCVCCLQLSPTSLLLPVVVWLADITL